MYNADGQLVTGSFMDYALPRATDFPRFELSATVTPTPVNPLGAKGVGEAGTLGSTPCVVVGGRGRAERVRREAHRHDAAAREAVADHPGRPGVIPTAFDYERATSLDDALAKLKAGGKIIAGGHSLVPLMKLRLSEPERLIDIARIPELRGHPRVERANRDRRRDDPSRGGDVAGDRCSHCPVLAEAAATIGDPQVRNRGTMGGSLAHADPSADYPAVMLALDAEIQIAGPSRPAQREGVGLLPGSVHGRSRDRRDHHGRRGEAGSHGRLRQAVSARVSLRDRRRRCRARDQRRHDRVGARRADRRQLACAAADERRAGARRTARHPPKPSMRRQRWRAPAFENVSSDIHAGEEYRRAMIGVFARRALAAALARG